MTASDPTTRGLVLAVSVTAPLVIASSGAISYSSLYQLALVVGGYGQLEAHLFPFPIDFTLGGAVAASFLLARWQAPRGSRFWVALQVLASAVVTISGNALHGTIVGDLHSWPWALRLAVSGVPGAAIVGMTHTVTVMLRCRPGAAEDRAAAPAAQGVRHALQAGASTELVPGSLSRSARGKRSATAPKEARVRALLENARVAQLDRGERARLIARIAADVQGSASYVRKIAGRLERESHSSPSSIAPEVVR